MHKIKLFYILLWQIIPKSLLAQGTSDQETLLDPCKSTRLGIEVYVMAEMNLRYLPSTSNYVQLSYLKKRLCIKILLIITGTQTEVQLQHGHTRMQPMGTGTVTSTRHRGHPKISVIFLHVM